jgi:hypothetical protein
LCGPPAVVRYPVFRDVAEHAGSVLAPEWHRDGGGHGRGIMVEQIAETIVAERVVVKKAVSKKVIGEEASW